MVDVELEARRPGRAGARLACEAREQRRHVHRRQRRLVRRRFQPRELEQVLDDLAHALRLAAHVGDRLAPFRRERRASSASSST